MSPSSPALRCHPRSYFLPPSPVLPGPAPDALNGELEVDEESKSGTCLVFSSDVLLDGRPVSVSMTPLEIFGRKTFTGRSSDVDGASHFPSETHVEGYDEGHRPGIRWKNSSLKAK